MIFRNTPALKDIGKSLTSQLEVYCKSTQLDTGNSICWDCKHPHNNIEKNLLPSNMILSKVRSYDQPI